MARLPQPGSDKGTWGNVLNEYLSEAHNGDGTLKDISQSKIINLQSDLAAKANTSAIPTTPGQVGAEPVGLSSATQTALSELYVRGVYSDTAPTNLPEGAIWFTARVDTTPPTAPSTLVANSSINGISLTWNASTDDSGAIGEYRIYRDGQLIGASLATNYTDNTAPWDTLCSYTVTARDPFNNESDPSNTATGARGQTGAPVAPLTGLIAQFRAADINIANGAAVTAWANRRAPDADFVIVGGPLYSTTGTRPSVVFDGVDDRASAAIGVMAQPSTRIFIGRMVTATAGKTIMGTTNNSTNRNILSMSGSTGKYSMYGGTNTRDSTVNADTSVHFFATVFNGASSLIVVDGTVTTMSTPGAEAGEGVRLGANPGLSNFSNIEAQEVLVYDHALTQSEIASIRAAYQTWYALP